MIRNYKIFFSVFLCINICLITVTLFAQQTAYRNFIEQLNEFEKDGNYEEALVYLNGQKNKFPDRFFELSKEEIFINDKLMHYEENLIIFMEGHQQGYFYFIHPAMPKFKPYSSFSGFDSISNIDLQLRETAIAKSEIIYEVSLPWNFSNGHKYPVCLIFHGGGSNLKKVKEHWHSNELDENFIKVYLQSYRHYDSDTYGWTSDDIRANEYVLQIFSELSEEYSIDTSMLIVTGISAGATYALDISLKQIIPISGFISFCPGIPKILDEKRFQNISDLKLKGYIVGGENDYYLPKQKQMTEIMDKAEIPHKYIVIEGMGHQYPDNESEWIDKAIDFLKDKDSSS